MGISIALAAVDDQHIRPLQHLDQFQLADRHDARNRDQRLNDGRRHRARGLRPLAADPMIGILDAPHLDRAVGRVDHHSREIGGDPDLGRRGITVIFGRMECALAAGQDQAAILTGLRALRYSNSIGLRYPSAEWSRVAL